MKTTPILVCCTALAVRAMFVGAGAEPPRLSLNHSTTGLELSWPGTVKAADGATVRPYFELQRSSENAAKGFSMWRT